MFAGSEAGGKAMAIAFTLINAAKMNGVDSFAYLKPTLEAIAAILPRIERLVTERPTHGCRRITALLNRELRSRGYRLLTTSGSTAS